jgi:murein L,D-transpeptidase YcbB/YkuD
MMYPGRVIRAGEQDSNIVKALKAQLNQALGTNDDPELRLDPNEPHFGPRMEQLVKLFQARNVDGEGRPLRQDGKIGQVTWAALSVTTPCRYTRKPTTAS